MGCDSEGYAGVGLFLAGEWVNFKWGLRLRMVKQRLVLVGMRGNFER
jgi:hypothetical protein